MLSTPVEWNYRNLEMMAVTLYQFHSRSCHDLSKELIKVESQSVKIVSKKGIYFDETSSEDSDGSRRASLESIIIIDLFEKIGFVA